MAAQRDGRFGSEILQEHREKLSSDNQGLGIAWQVFVILLRIRIT